MDRLFRSFKSEWLPKGGYGDFSHAVRDINQWINGYYNFIDLIQTMVVYRLACMKKSGNRLFQCPDFVLHYKTELNLQTDNPDRTVTKQAVRPFLNHAYL